MDRDTVDLAPQHRSPSEHAAKEGARVARASDDDLGGWVRSLDRIWCPHVQRGIAAGVGWGEPNRLDVRLVPDLVCVWRPSRERWVCAPERAAAAVPGGQAAGEGREVS